MRIVKTTDYEQVKLAGHREWVTDKRDRFHIDLTDYEMRALRVAFNVFKNEYDNDESMQQDLLSLESAILVIERAFNDPEQ